jgi:hypothetical protein
MGHSIKLIVKKGACRKDGTALVHCPPLFIQFNVKLSIGNPDFAY